ncbi:MAG: type II toxin-antitoxin system PemK/MazF family toxin [Candidatus Tectimicrobiota bacterium]
MTTYEFGDVVLVAFPQSGTSVRKRRPALVILDIGNADVVLAPLTTRARAGPGDAALREWAASGLLRASWVRLAKLACLAKDDITRHLGHLTNDEQAGLVALWQAVYTFAPRP